MGIIETHNINSFHWKSSFEYLHYPIIKSTSDSSLETNDESTSSFSSTIFYTFEWKKNGGNVLISGSFCNWKFNHMLTKNKNGIFSITLEIPIGLNEFKFIVDGKNEISNFYPSKKNNKGIDINYIFIKSENEEKKESEKKEKERKKVNSDGYTSVISDLNSKLGKTKPLPLFYKNYFESNLNNKNLLLNGFYTPNVIINHLLNSKTYISNNIIRSSCKIRNHEKVIKFVYYKPKN